jgi:O-antigen/teichoic acid export membrane protein
LGIAGFFWGNLIVLVLSVPFGLLLTKKDLQFHIDFKVARRLVHYGYPFIFAGLAYWIFGSLDRWMLGFMTDNTQVGYFSISFKLGVILIFINSAFGQAWSPYSVKIYAEQANYRQIFSQILSYWFFGLTIVGAILTLFAQEILMLLTPVAYWQAKSVLGYIAMGLVFYGTTQLTAFGLSIEKRTQLFSVAAWITAAINLVLNLILIPLFKANGAAIASLVSYMSLTGLYLFWTQKLHPIPLEKPKLLLSLSIIILTILLTQFFYLFSWSWPITGGKIVLLSFLCFTGYKFKLIPIQSLLNAIKKPK